MSIKKRKLPFTESPHDNIRSGALATNTDKKKKGNKKEDGHIQIRMDRNKIICLKCREEQTFPATHDYRLVIKPLMDGFREKHRHEL